MASIGSPGHPARPFPLAMASARQPWPTTDPKRLKNSMGKAGEAELACLGKPRRQGASDQNRAWWWSKKRNSLEAGFSSLSQDFLSMQIQESCAVRIGELSPQRLWETISNRDNTSLIAPFIGASKFAVRAHLLREQQIKIPVVIAKTKKNNSFRIRH